MNNKKNISNGATKLLQVCTNGMCYSNLSTEINRTPSNCRLQPVLGTNVYRLSRYGSGVWNCSSCSVSPNVVAWTRGRDNEFLPSSFIDRFGVLEIRNGTEIDSGEYKCFSSNRWNTELTYGFLIFGGEIYFMFTSFP